MPVESFIGLEQEDTRISSIDDWLEGHCRRLNHVLDRVPRNNDRQTRARQTRQERKVNGQVIRMVQGSLSEIILLVVPIYKMRGSQCHTRSCLVWTEAMYTS